jgi:hypothetical protein
VGGTANDKTRLHCGEGERCPRRNIGIGPSNLDNLERIIVPTLNATFLVLHSIRETLIREALSTDLKAAELGLCIVEAKIPRSWLGPSIEKRY